jgi:hypothetical protein
MPLPLKAQQQAAHEKLLLTFEPLRDGKRGGATTVDVLFYKCICFRVTGLNDTLDTVRRSNFRCLKDTAESVSEIKGI